MIEVVGMDEWRIVVPVRFRRFNAGHLPAIDCPEIDNRGFKMGTRPDPWGTTTVRGPTFGVVVGDTVKVAVVREDLDEGAPLFVTSSDTATLRVETANGGPLADTGEVQVHGVASGTASVQIRLGAVGGPIISESDVRVHTLLRVALTPHLVRIDSTTTTGVAPVMPIADMVRRLRAIWRPCGVDFRVATTVSEHVTLPSNVVGFIDIEHAGWKDDVRGVLGLQRTRLNIAAGSHDESINWYIIPQFVAGSDGLQTVGLGVSRQTADGWGMTDTGILVASQDSGGARDPEFASRTLAHEIGHFFRLKHVQEHNGTDPVKDTYGRRQLMFPLSNLSGGTGGLGVPRFDNVGYGDGVRGCLLTMKNHAHHSTDGECATSRNAIHSNNWF